MVGAEGRPGDVVSPFTLIELTNMMRLTPARDAARARRSVADDVRLVVRARRIEQALAHDVRASSEMHDHVSAASARTNVASEMVARSPTA